MSATSSAPAFSVHRSSPTAYVDCALCFSRQSPQLSFPESARLFPMQDKLYLHNTPAPGISNSVLSVLSNFPQERVAACPLPELSELRPGTHEPTYADDPFSGSILHHNVLDDCLPRRAEMQRSLRPQVSSTV